MHVNQRARQPARTSVGLDPHPPAPHERPRLVLIDIELAAGLDAEQVAVDEGRVARAGIAPPHPRALALAEPSVASGSPQGEA
jgi:hypothetical protein